MRLNKLITATLGGAAVAVLLAGCGGPGAPSEEPQGSETSDPFEAMEPIVLKVSDPNTELATSVVSLKTWADEVTEKTGGKVTFEWYYAGVLHSSAEAFSAIESGLTDVTYISLGTHIHEVPITGWAAKAAPKQGTEFPGAVLVGTGAYTGLFEQDDSIRAEYSNRDAVPLVTWSSPAVDLLCSEPVDSLAAATGKLARTTGSPFVEELESIGMGTVFLENSEFYDAFQRGIIQCIAGGVPSFITNSLEEVAKHYTPASMSPQAGGGYVIRQEVWDNLPVEVQRVMHDAKATFLTEFMKQTLSRYETWTELLTEQGVTIHDGRELNPKIEAVQQTLVDSLAEIAPEALSDPEAVLATLDREVEFWNSAVDDLDIASEVRTPDNVVELYAGAADLPWDSYHQSLVEFLDRFRP